MPGFARSATAEESIMKLFINRTYVLPNNLLEQYWGGWKYTCLWFVVFAESGEFLGYGGLSFDGKEWWLGPTLVFPKYRGLSVQRILIEARILYCRKYKAKVLKTMAYLWNKYSIRNIVKSGFKQVAVKGSQLFFQKEL